MPFSLVPKVLYAIDMSALGIDQFMVVVDSFVVVSFHGQSVISAPGIRKHNTGWRNFPANDWHQLGSSTIGNHLGINLSPRFTMPKTAIFPAAPLPLMPLRLPPKYDSSFPTAPSNASDIFYSWYSAINLRILVKNNAAVFRCTPNISPAARAVDPDTNSFNRSPV